MQTEKYGNREAEMIYSVWHRRESTKRFIGWERATVLSMINADQPITIWCEYIEPTYMPVAILETALDIGQTNKPAMVTTKLVEMPPRRAYTVLFKISKEKNPADPNYADIESFRLKRLWPYPEEGWHTMNPKEYAEWLWQLRYGSSQY
jgi:hypothetical protein